MRKVYELLFFLVYLVYIYVVGKSGKLTEMNEILRVTNEVEKSFQTRKNMV